MLVVADASPINVMIRIGVVDVLPKLFREVLIPPVVFVELTHPRTPDVVSNFMKVLPDWLRVEEPEVELSIPSIDRGEEQAISLAAGIHADLLLIDDYQGRRAAKSRSLGVIGTVGVLELAAASDLLNLRDVSDRLLATDFQIDVRYINEAIKRDEKRRRG